MSDTPDTETRAWEFTEVGVIVLPGISWEEWETLWTVARGMHRSALFAVGDTLNAGETEFGEQYAQVIDGYAVETTKVALWVSRRIEHARRRPSLSWSVHKEVASLDPGDQDALLDQAEAEGWHSREMNAAAQALKAQRKAEKDAARQARRNAQAPEEQVDPEEQHHAGKFYKDDPSEVTRVTEDESPAEAATEAEPIWGRNTPPEAEQPSPDPPFVASEPLEDPAEELRSIIDGIRWVANDLVLGKADLQSVQDLERRTLGALGRPMYSASPLRTDMPAERLIPPEWSVKIEAGEFVFGGRKWTVELRKGNQRAIGAGPSLACAVTEAVLAAALSTLTAAKR